MKKVCVLFSKGMIILKMEFWRDVTKAKFSIWHGCWTGESPD